MAVGTAVSPGPRPPVCTGEGEWGQPEGLAPGPEAPGTTAPQAAAPGSQRWCELPQALGRPRRLPRLESGCVALQASVGRPWGRQGGMQKLCCLAYKREAQVLFEFHEEHLSRSLSCMPSSLACACVHHSTLLTDCPATCVLPLVLLSCQSRQAPLGDWCWNAGVGAFLMPGVLCPPGMVLVRSENGQLLMIPQQALAQMQAQAHAQAQPQTTMAPRPATPTSAPPVQISTVQVSACVRPTVPAWAVWHASRHPPRGGWCWRHGWPCSEEPAPGPRALTLLLAPALLARDFTFLYPRFLFCKVEIRPVLISQGCTRTELRLPVLRIVEQSKH